MYELFFFSFSERVLRVLVGNTLNQSQECNEG